MKTRAAVLPEPNHPFVIEDVDLAAPKAGEVLVKIAAAGVCHSDWHLASGATQHPFPVVAGHEGAGTVVDLGPNVSDLQPDDHVVLNWAPACGHCFYCQRNRPNLCATWTAPIWAGTMLDGTTRLSWRDQPLYHYCGLASFADHAVVPAASCVKIDPAVPLASAALVGCAVATGVGAALYTASVRPGESAAVFGCGGVGLNVVQGAALAGATPIVAVDTNPAKDPIARTFGATHFLQPSPNLLDDLRALTGNRGPDHAFEAVGLPHLQELAFHAARPGGTVTLAGLSPMGTPTNLPGAVITRTEKTIKGSYYGTTDPHRDFPLFIDLYQQKKLKLDELITKRYRLEEINEAFAAMLHGDLARGIIEF